MVSPESSLSSSSGDTPNAYCADFGAILDTRGLSLRAAAARSGWGKTTIAAARRGPNLPNVDLVVDVLQAAGESAETQREWRLRHERLAQNHALAASSAGPASMFDSDVEANSVGGRGWQLSRWVGMGLVLVVVIGAAAWLLGNHQNRDNGRTIVVQNKVAVGASDLREDDSPSYLAARPVSRCANLPGCKLSGTDMASGDAIKAVCQLQGTLITNADVKSQGIRSNPNAAASALWYGIAWPDGRRGYISEVYVAPNYRGGLQLPAC